MGYEQALEYRHRLFEKVRNDDLVPGKKERVADAKAMFRKSNADGSLADRFDDWQMLATGVADSDPYYWSVEMVDMLKSVSEHMPEWTLRQESVPSKRGFIYFSSPVYSYTSNDIDIEVRAIGFGPELHGSGLKISIWRDTKGTSKIPVPIIISWPFGENLSERIKDIENVYYVSCLRIIACTFALMEQTIVGKTAERAPRATRRRLGEVGETPIQVIHLRRTIRTSSVGDDREKAYELTCQFVVRMHWRNQFYPSDGSHRPKLIAPHIKGPEGAPMKVHVDRIFVVDR